MYPALSVLATLGDEAQPVLWIGSESGMEAELVKRNGVAYTGIPAAGVHGVGLRALPGNLAQLARGAVAARKIIQDFKPDVMFFTGGYVGVPVALAGRGYPTLLYNPDIEPGMALKALARFADCIAITADPSRAFFSKRTRTVVTGYPTRSDLVTWEKAAAREKLNLTDQLPVLLVYGGSKGAHSINQALFAALPQLLTLAQIVHITGTPDAAEAENARARLHPRLSTRYHPTPYLHEMGAAFASADLAVSRAGASTLGEYPLFGLPAILVPYPHAWRYQRVNADYLAQRGAAQVLEDARLGSDLTTLVTSLLNDAPRLKAMQQAMRALAVPDASAQIAGLVRELAGAPGKKGSGLL